MPTAADMQTLWPATFGSVDVAVLSTFIAHAALIVKNVQGLGDRYDLAVLYKAAELAFPSANGGAGAGGPIQSMTAGKISVTYAVGGGAGGMSSNAFASMYENLINGVAALRLPGGG